MEDFPQPLPPLTRGVPHILENHSEMQDNEDRLRETLRTENRRQESLNPQKFRYLNAFDGLADDNTHIEAIVLFRFGDSEEGKPVPNNYVVTAYQKEIW